MRFRLLIALILVLAVVFGGGLTATAGHDPEPHCWWFSYTVAVMGRKVVKIPNTCVPCFGICDWYEVPSGTAGQGGTSKIVSVYR